MLLYKIETGNIFTSGQKNFSVLEPGNLRYLPIDNDLILCDLIQHAQKIALCNETGQCAVDGFLYHFTPILV